MNMHTTGALPRQDLLTLEACMEECAVVLLWTCYGLDWDPLSSIARCWIVTNPLAKDDLRPMTGATFWELVSPCRVTTTRKYSVCLCLRMWGSGVPNTYSGHLTRYRHPLG